MEEHLEKQPRSEEEISLFLLFGNQYVNPILNALLLRGQHVGTFDRLCEYIIMQSLGRK